MEYTLKDGKIIQIREVKLSDAVLLLDFFTIVNTETKNLIRDPGEDTMTLSDERKFIRRVMNSIYQYIYIVMYDEEIIGSIGFRSSHFQRITHRASIGMSVLQKFNNLGLGTIMMETIIKKAKEVGKLKMELTVRVDNPNAVHLYEKFGFEIEGACKKGFFVDNEFIDLHLMGKWL
jgi:RimJ/RimL family protein N-acetyltransferase